MKTSKSLSIVALAFAMTSLMATAADTGSALNSADEKFVKHAAMHGQSEVKIAELGVKKAENAEVKAIAEQMVQDHSAINGELAQFAQSKGVELSVAGDPKAVDAVASLEKESGSAFDKAFLKELQAGHKKSVDAYEEASKDAKDGALKSWVDKTLPMIKGHLDRINKALESL